MRRRTVLAGVLLLAGLLLCSAATVAKAEFKPLSPFAATEAVPPSAFGPPSAAPFQAPGPFGRLFAWVLEQQQGLQRMLAASVKSLKADNPMAGAFTLAGLSFLYGILHAVGPGHGKTIISSYVVANEETVRRGVLISFIASALQAFTAVAPGRCAVDRAWRNRAPGQCLVQSARKRELCAVPWSVFIYCGPRSPVCGDAAFLAIRPLKPTMVMAAIVMAHMFMTIITTITTTRTVATISSMRGNSQVQCLGAR